MRVSSALAIRLCLGLAAVVGSAVLLSSSDRPAFTTGEKAYYADPNMVSFVRPGLVVKIVSGSVADDGTMQVRFKLTDPKGLPLDRNGVTTPGAISTRIVPAYIPSGQTQYKSYAVRQVTSALTKQTATQATYDSGGTYQAVADGEYIYTLATKAPQGFDKTATHTFGIWAGRDLSEFDLDSITNYASDVYSFVPNGSKVTVTRDVVRTEACNRCHDPLQAHDERRGVEICVLCHTPQSADPDSGNTVNFPVMIHKIHAGESLPSVQAGGKYQIIGYQNAVQDFSTVVFPADVRRCQVCHDPNSGAAQANNWLKPNMDACGACHDNVNFTTGENHANGLPVASNKECANCHVPQGELEFDASIMGAHTIPEFSKTLKGVNFQILAVDNGAAGQKPTVSFSLKDNAGNPLPMISRLSLVMAGPTTDYGFQVSEDVTKAQGTTDGRYFWTFANAVPADAKGTFTMGIEGYNNATLYKGTTKERSVREAGINKTFDFSVDGSPVAPRRTVVSIDKCDSCHAFLSLHGGNRNQIQQCVLCHNPTGTDASVRPAAQGAAQTIQFAYMIHRIHTGEQAGEEPDASGQPVEPYIIYGHGSSVNDFSEVRFPGDRRNCAECHVDGSEQLPLTGTNRLSVESPRGLLNPMSPATAACTGCHVGAATASHALSNTTDKLGEACAACHSTGYEYGVPKAHAR